MAYPLLILIIGVLQRYPLQVSAQGGAPVINASDATKATRTIEFQPNTRTTPSNQMSSTGVSASATSNALLSTYMSTSLQSSTSETLVVLNDASSTSVSDHSKTSSPSAGLASSSSTDSRSSPSIQISAKVDSSTVKESTLSTLWSSNDPQLSTASSTMTSASSTSLSVMPSTSDLTMAKSSTAEASSLLSSTVASSSGVSSDPSMGSGSSIEATPASSSSIVPIPSSSSPGSSVISQSLTISTPASSSSAAGLPSGVSSGSLTSWESIPPSPSSTATVASSTPSVPWLPSESSSSNPQGNPWLPSETSSPFSQGKTTSISTDTESHPPTTTITTVPPGFSTDFVTYPGITGNTWLTTSKKGETSSTILPVILCRKCGGEIAIFGLPPWPRVKWTKLPGLPKIHFPCFPILFIRTCSSPPQVDSEDGDEGDKDPSKSKDPDKPEDPSKSDGPSKIEDSGKSSSSTTTSCSVRITTATDCSVAYSAFQSTVGSDVVSTTACYTTKCQQTIGCSVEATTTISITTSEVEACPWLPQTPYNAIATYKDAGIELPGWMQYPITNDMMANPEPGEDENADEDGEDGTTDSNGDPIYDSGDDFGFDIPAMMTMSFTKSADPDYEALTGHPLATHPRPPKQQSISGPVDFPPPNSPPASSGQGHIQPTELSLIIPTFSYTPVPITKSIKRPSQGHTEVAETSIDIPTWTYTPIPASESTSKSGQGRIQSTAPSLDVPTFSYTVPPSVSVTTITPEPVYTTTFLPPSLSKTTRWIACVGVWGGNCW